MHLDEEKSRSESPRNEESDPEEEIDNSKTEDTRLLIIDAYKMQLTRFTVRNTGYFNQQTEDEAMETLRADERKRAEEASKANEISTRREPINRLGTLQSQNQSVPNRRVEKGTISQSLYHSE